MMNFFQAKLILIILLLLSFTLRVYQLDKVTIYPDEITWMVRGKESVFAIKQLNFDYFIKSAWWERPAIAEAIALPLVIPSGLSMITLGQGQSNYSLHLFNEITAARLPVAILNSLLIPLFYLFAKKYFSTKISLITALLLAFDPIHLSLSRWVMLDGLLTLFTFASVYFFFFTRTRILTISLAGLSLAAAFLTKPLGMLPILSWIVFSMINSPKTQLLKRLFNKHLLYSTGIFLLLVWLLWLGEWNQPIISMVDYFLHQKQLTEHGYRILYLGAITSQPSVFYYLPQILFRLPSITAILFLFSIIFFAIKLAAARKQQKLIVWISPLIPLAIFPLIYFSAVSLAALKLGVRYTLHLWPWIYLTVAWSLNSIFTKIQIKPLRILFIIILLSTNFVSYKQYLPNFYLYYNNFIGGSSGAQKYDLVGQCISTKPALEYLNTNYPKIKSVAILGCSNVTAPYYFNGKITTDWKSEKAVIIETTYSQLLPDNPEVKFYQSLKPVFEVEVQGAILSKIYLNDISKD